jgi:plasmid maintenance system antidote protein VapI
MLIALPELSCTMQPMATVSEQLRKAVEKSGQTRYAIAKATGIPASVLSRFVASGAGLRSQNLDRLCAYFGMGLVPKTTKNRKGR